MRSVRFTALGAVFQVERGRLAVFKLTGEHNVYEAIARQRRKMLAGEDLAMKRMAGAWKVAEKGIHAKLDAVTEKIAQAQAAGVAVSPAWLYQQERYQALLQVTGAEIAKYSNAALTIAQQQQTQAFKQGQADAKELVSAAGVKTGFKALNKEAFENMVGMLTDKSPLHDLFSKIAPDAVQKAREIFAVEMAAGSNPSEMARQLKDALGISKKRAMLISRTESARAYLQSQRENYKANSDVVVASRLVSARDSRTCPLCWGLDGQIIEHADDFGHPHPGCRCALMPVVKYLDVQRKTGEEVLAEMESAKPGYARQILGPARYDLWKSGQVALKDLIQHVDHPRWGRGVRPKTLKALESDIKAGLTGTPTPKVPNLGGHVAGSPPTPMPDLMAPNPKWAPPVIAPTLPSVPADAQSKSDYIESILADIAAGNRPHMTPDEIESAANQQFPNALKWDPKKMIEPKYKKYGLDPNPPASPGAKAATSATSVAQLLGKVSEPTNLKYPTDYLQKIIKESGKNLTADQVVAIHKFYFPSSKTTTDAVLHQYAKHGIVPIGGFPAGFEYTPKVKGKPKAQVADVVQQPAQPAVPAVPVKSAADVILKQQVGPQKGSNPGGLYLGEDGVQRYVKFYEKPGQAYAEHLANQIYNRIGLTAPVSTLFTDGGGRLCYASEILPVEGTVGQLGLTKPLAKEILKGFAADVLLANRDAVGSGLDNVVVLKGGGVARIDAGGALLYRAMGSLKPDYDLDVIGEWDGLAPGGKNADYAKVWKEAGHSGPDAMGAQMVAAIREIVKLRQDLGGWDAYVKVNTPGMDPIQQDRIAAMLDDRTNLLKLKADAIEKALAAKKALAKLKRQAKAEGGELPTGANGFKEAKRPEAAQQMRKDMAKGVFRKLSPDQLSAVRQYKGSTYGPMNHAMRRLSEASEYVAKVIADLRSAFRHANPVKEDMMLFRGIPKHVEWHAKTAADIGDVISDPAFISCASWETFSFEWADGGSAPVLLRIRVPKGTRYVPAQDETSSDWEYEFIAHGGAWRIIGVSKRGNMTVLDVEQIGSMEDGTEWVNRWQG